jgi:hypothetical protein
MRSFYFGFSDIASDLFLILQNFWLDTISDNRNQFARRADLSQRDANICADRHTVAEPRGGVELL